MYKNDADLIADHLTRFGGFRSCTDDAGAFSLQVYVSSANSNAFIGSRLVMFGD